jgi:4-hydroxy-tetrahydrodipicolinate synthase
LAAVQERVLSAKTEEAAALFEALLPVIGLLFSSPNPAGIKAALAVNGLINKETRMPILEASQELVDRLRVELAVYANA